MARIYIISAHTHTLLLSFLKIPFEDTGTYSPSSDTWRIPLEETTSLELEEQRLKGESDDSLISRIVQAAFRASRERNLQ